MSTYSTNLKIELITPGTQAGVWGTTTNTNLGTLIEQAISGIVTQAITDGADTVITMPDGATGVARNMVIECTGALTAARNLVVPANKKLYFIYNNTTGGKAVTVKVSGQTGISVPNGAKVILMMNSAGTDIVTATNYMVAATLVTPALDAETYSTSATVTAGTNAQGQGALTSDINVITTASSNPSGVTLPTATTGRIVAIVNKGANAVNVYPATSAYIDGLSINTSIQIPAGSSLQFVASSTTQWYSSATGDTGSGANVRQVAPQLDAETYTTSATVSAAGTTQGTATALTSDYNIITTVTSSASGVILPTATAGRRIIIVNKDAADAVNIYPATGASIDALSTNAAFSLPVDGWLELNASSTTKWYSSYNAYLATPTTATNATNLVTTNFSISESGGVLAFIAHPSFTASIASTTMTVTSASAGYVVYGATLTGTGVTGGTTVGVQLTSTETTAASPTFSSGGAVGDNSFVVSSASGIAVGQIIAGTGVPSGTYVLSIDGTTIYLCDRTGAAVEFTIQAAGTYNFRTAAAKGTYTVSASQTVSSTTITGTKTVAQITNTGLITSQP
jgi:hypothetical protein